MATHGIDPQARGLAARPNLNGIAGLTGTGIVSHTGTGTFTERTITGTASQIGVTNGDGVSGNPTLALLGNPLALAGLTGATDKLAYFTGASAMALTDFTSFARTLVANTTAPDARLDLAAMGDVTTRAALTAMTKASLTTGQEVTTASYGTLGDQGGGTFRWDSAATDTVNAGTIFASDEGGAGRWQFQNRVDAENVSVDLFGVNPSNSAAVNSTRLQAAINASYGKRLWLRRYADGSAPSFDTTLAINPVYNSANRPIEICGQGFDADGGNSGTYLRYTGSGNAIEIHNTSGVSADTRVYLHDFGLFGDGTNVAGGHGISVKQSNGGTLLERLWLQNHRADGVFLEHSYGAQIRDCIVTGNRRHGVEVTDRCNDLALSGCKIVSNARVPDSSANVRIANGVGSASLLPIINNCDFSYAGYTAFTKYLRSDNSLTDIVVATNVATATTAAAHGLTTGDYMAVKGATAATALNNLVGYSVTVTGATTFTFATSGVADATYTEAGLSIYPYSYGLSSASGVGLHVINFYAEQCTGLNAYISGTTVPFLIDGGYNQDGRMLYDTVTNGTIRGVKNSLVTTGWNTGQYVDLAGNHYVDYDWSNVAGAGTTFVGPDPYMRGQTYYGTAAPASGTWVAGQIVYNSAPAAGGVPGWVCVTGGTPGTWKAQAVLAA